MNHTVLYARSATNEGGLERQIAEGVMWCIQNGYTPQEIIVDRQGAYNYRPGFARLMAKIASGTIGRVVVEEHSRFARDVAELMTFQAAARAQEVEIITIR